MTVAAQSDKLAIDGGTPAVTQPLPPMFPGGMRIGREEEEAVLSVLRSKRLFRFYGPTDGPSRVAELEEAFAATIGPQFCTAVTSGWGALTCGLVGLGVGPGDEVLVPAYTWISTASAVVAAGAVPILVEVDESLTIDPADVERKISPYTKALIVVHMRGGPCQMDELTAIARRHNLTILEDVAQADGGSFHGQRLGSIGDAGAFSLQFNKIITAGEGGLVTTNDADIHQRVLMYSDVDGGLRNGIPADELFIGFNFRMSELQGAVALVQLSRLEEMLAAMRRHKAVLKERIADVAQQRGIEFRRLNDPAGEAGICIIFYLPTAERADFVTRALRAEGMRVSLLYEPERTDYHVYRHWTPILAKRMASPTAGPWQGHPRDIEYDPDACPRSLDLLGRAVQIDVSPDLTAQNIEEMSAAVNKVLAAGRGLREE